MPPLYANNIPTDQPHPRPAWSAMEWQGQCHVGVSQSMRRRPKKWLNYVTGLDPKLGPSLIR